MNVLHYLRKDPIRITLAVSLLLHAAALVKIPALHPPPKPEVTRGGPLIVQLAPPPSPAVRPPPPARAARPPAPPEPPRAVERPPPRPPVIARNDPAPVVVPPPRPSPPAAAPATPVPPSSGDFAAFVEARRRERGETASAPPAPSLTTAQSAPAPLTAEVENANARATRLAAANLGLDRKPTFGPERRSGGIFDPTYISSDYAKFIFYGWNKEIHRNTQQEIEVRRGQNPDIRIAMVRRMIVIIREHEKEDFVWESKRLNRDVTLSARLRDNAALEDFLMREFFEDTRRPAASR